jgi:hypothetical protein
MTKTMNQIFIFPPPKAVVDVEKVENGNGYNTYHSSYKKFNRFG